MISLRKVKTQFIRHFSNLPGWRTKRKIVVFEVDDFGSVRIASKQAWVNLKKKGVDVETNRFNRFDTVAGKEDLEPLFDMLTSVKDKNGRHAVFTAVSVVANPDFKKIQESNFEQYFYEPFFETLEKYPDTSEVKALWKQGIDSNIFAPEFHGREHLNVNYWMELLRQKDSSVIRAFEEHSIGVPPNTKQKKSYSTAFDFETTDHLYSMNQIIESGIGLFKQQFGFQPSHFTSSGLIHSKQLEPLLLEKNIKFIDEARKGKEPVPGGQYKSRWHYLGQKGYSGLIYITRNAMFEPSLGEKDWVNSCLNDISLAFRWHKPAIISSHRVNFVGGIEPKNREDGLISLKTLLKTIVTKWPDVEFMSVSDLGRLILKRKTNGKLD